MTDSQKTPDFITHAKKVRKLLQTRFVDKIPLAHLHSYGCQQNVSDGERIMGLLALMGYGFTDMPQDADLVIYNTCAVRENAEDRVYGNIGELKHVKEKNRDMVIALCGCMVQQEHIAQKIIKSYPQVDIVFGTHAIDKLPQLLLAALNKHSRQVELSMGDYILPEELTALRVKSQGEKTIKANLPIMYGCNNFCTYCVVPYVRGREKSRKSADIILEFTELIKEGYKEITLLGQNVNSYGKGLLEKIDFSALLRLLNQVEGDFRIRFMSSHPKDATFELIDTIAACDKVCAHFHLPVQSGSDKILRLMNRGYSAKEYLRLIEYARSVIPEIAFTSDIIVGFPGETAEDFSDTLELIDKVRFDSIFSFIYSKRVGTKAALMKDDTPPKTKTEWFMKLLEAQKVIGREKYADCVGREYRVLAEGTAKSENGFLTGRSAGYAIIDFKGEQSLIGQFVTVRVTKSLGWALVGEIV